MSLPHDTPVDTPQVGVPRKKTKQELEWEAQAAAYKADGYNSAVVARKMIQMHAMPEPEAERLVGELFGKKVNARAGDTTGAVVVGLAMLAAGLAGAAIFYAIVGLAFLKFTFVVYLALLGVAGKGATQTIIALANANSGESLQK
jgi:hypothetical protein